MSEQFGAVRAVQIIQYNIPIHVGFTLNRFQLGQDGQTPYSRTWGQKNKSAIIAFGETVLCQHSNHDNQKIPIRLETQ
eukprot:2283575-Amphidinium_carterae.4